MERTDIAIVRSSAIENGRLYKLFFDPAHGPPTRTQVMGRLQTLLTSQLFSECQVPSKEIRIGDHSIEARVYSSKSLPDNFRYSRVTNLRSVIDDVCNAILVENGDRITFRTGIARYTGIVSSVRGANEGKRHIVTADDGNVYRVAPLAVVDIHSGHQKVIKTAAQIVKERLYS